jgi:hypothetical protein
MSPQQTNTTLNELEIALFLQREKLRLPERHHEFIDDMANTLSRPPGLTRKQTEYLYALFDKLGGKIT